MARRRSRERKRSERSRRWRSHDFRGGCSKIAAAQIIVMTINRSSGSRRIISTVEISLFRWKGWGRGEGPLYRRTDPRARLILSLADLFPSLLLVIIGEISSGRSVSGSGWYPGCRTCICFVTSSQMIASYIGLLPFPFREWDKAR